MMLASKQTLIIIILSKTLFSYFGPELAKELDIDSLIFASEIICIVDKLNPEIKYNKKYDTYFIEVDVVNKIKGSPPNHINIKIDKTTKSLLEIFYKQLYNDTIKHYVESFFWMTGEYAPVFSKLDSWDNFIINECLLIANGSKNRQLIAIEKHFNDFFRIPKSPGKKTFAIRKFPNITYAKNDSLEKIHFYNYYFINQKYLESDKLRIPYYFYTPGLVKSPIEFKNSDEEFLYKHKNPEIELNIVKKIIEINID